MENVLVNNRDVRGYIDPRGIFIRIAHLDLGEDLVEIIAESIVRNIEKSTVLEQTMKERYNTNGNRLYQNYLIDYYFYVYIHLYYGDESVEIREIKSPKDIEDVTDFQKNRIKILCKNGIATEDLPKILEIGGKNEKF